MKDKLNIGSKVLKGLIKTGGDVADKALDKGRDVATVMMNNMTVLISKLADDIGVMANRVLTMEERIGLMADRMVRTEELMAKWTASLANKDLDLSSGDSVAKRASQTTVLSMSATEVSGNTAPELMISGNPDIYLLYVATSPFFQDSSTVVSHIKDTNGYDVAWRRSINAIRGLAKNVKENKGEAIIVSVAVKTATETNQISTLSNSIDVTVYN